VYGWDLGPGIG